MSKPKQEKPSERLSRHIFRQCDLFAADRKNESPIDRFTLTDVAHDLAIWARSNPDYLDPYAWAKDNVDKWDSARRPNLKEDDLFPFDRVIPDGLGGRRYLADAKDGDLIEWLTIETAEIEKQLGAYSRKTKRINDWLKKFRDPVYRDCKNLGDIWRIDGWSGPPKPPKKEQEVEENTTLEPVDA